VKLRDIKAGDFIFADGSLPCGCAGQQEVKADENGDLYFVCSVGRHYLEMQMDEDGELVGLSRSST
jgi:hypothetical protein